MSSQFPAHDAMNIHSAHQAFERNNIDLYDQVLIMHKSNASQSADNNQPKNIHSNDLFVRINPNIVQSIRAFRPYDLCHEAISLNQHFLYANCSHAINKAEVLEKVATSFYFPKHFGKNYDALYNCLTDLLQKTGKQPGFVIVLEGLPTVHRFDKDARETLLDVFRDAAEFWAEQGNGVPFRVFYSFA